MNLPTDDEGRPTYRFNPKLLGGEVSVTLGHRALVWRTGAKSGELPYRDITGIKLAFQPANMQFSRYICVVEGKGAPRLTISNGHRISMMEFEARNDQFNELVRLLHGKVIAARATVQFQGGETPVRFGLMAMLAACVLVAALFLVPQLAEMSRSAILFWLFFAALALVPLGTWLWKNKPRSYDPAAIPPDLLPREN